VLLKFDDCIEGKGHCLKFQIPLRMPRIFFSFFLVFFMRVRYGGAELFTVGWWEGESHGGQGFYVGGLPTAIKRVGRNMWG